eukprot:jgi/Tetstr1/438734/TSEL_002930.t1
MTLSALAESIGMKPNSFGHIWTRKNSKAEKAIADFLERQSRPGPRGGMSLSPREILAKKREAQGALLAEVTADLGAKMHDHFRAAVRDAVREVLPESRKAVLLKVSASGETYFHKGKTHQIAADSGRTVVVAETSFFEGDAHRFGSLSEAQAEADWLNARGIGGAPWHAIEARPLFGDNKITGTKHMTAHTIMDLDLVAIDATGRLRKALPARVEALAEDLDQRGLLTPIEAVGPTEEGCYRLIYGAHRLAAAKLLGWAQIPAIIHAPDAFADEAEARLREIRENLMRFELNPMERAIAIAAWRDIYEAAHGKVQRGGNRRKKLADEHLDDQSANFALCFSEAAQAAFGLSQRAIYLALKIATISPDIRDRIADSPLVGNQSELLKLADQSPDRQAQIVGLVLAEPPTATTVDEAIAVIDKTQPAQMPKPWEKVSDRFSRLKRSEQHRFFEAHRDAIDLWLAERG